MPAKTGGRRASRPILFLFLLTEICSLITENSTHRVPRPSERMRVGRADRATTTQTSSPVTNNPQLITNPRLAATDKERLSYAPTQNNQTF